MRRQLALALVSAMFLPAADCCGVGEPYLLARYAVADCVWLGCPIAVGSEAQIMWGDEWGTDLAQIERGSVEVPSLAEVEVVDHDLLVRPLAAGTTRYEIALLDGSRFKGTFELAERARTETTSDLEAAKVGARPLVYAGAPFTVYAHHFDAQGRPLLGHGLEQWSATGGVLLPAPFLGTRDPHLTRMAVAADARVITVRARPDAAPLLVDVAMPGSAAHLELNYGVQRLFDTGTITLDHHTAVIVAVRPSTSTSRFLNGTPRRAGLVVATDNPAVATVKLTPGERAFELSTLSSGTTVLTVQFDGLVRRFRVDVP